MSYYVYIIESLLDGTYYKGSTQDPILRLKRHNNGESKYTSKKVPWKLVYVRIFETKTEALKEELRLKKTNRKYLTWLILSDSNELSQFESMNG
ncbi:MAG: GIY-YIG nuclease family protein [Carboxylicivirga sp.]|jgi:putative endonuclease|nr:GIY-YIG nuclease family protein [Carboxylicivirga sp.]